MNVIEKAIQWAVGIANDPSHGYDQIHRWGPDYDCSSLVISAYEMAGLPIRAHGGSYTGNMKAAFIRCGFKAIPYKKGMALIRGDVFFYHYVKDGKTHGHAVLYIGEGKIVQASINEKGKAVGGQPGDQTGREVSVGNFYIPARGWDYVLRYEKDEEKEEDKTVTITMPILQKGSRCAEVGTIQTLLNALGYLGKNGRRLTVDHDYGPNVEHAIKNFQKAHHIGQDGVVGSNTWNALLKADY